MADFITIFDNLKSYISTGGITMYPLIVCCFWMWFLVIRFAVFGRINVNAELKRYKNQFKSNQTGYMRADRNMAETMLCLEEHRLSKGHKTIAVIAAVAPLLGLFGTVTGMISTFESVAVFGLTNPKALAEGISEAMVTTQLGLIVAVPGMVAWYFLHRRAKRNFVIFEKAQARLLSEEFSTGDLV